MLRFNIIGLDYLQPMVLSDSMSKNVENQVAGKKMNYISWKINKWPTGLNSHLSIRDFTPTSCQKGSYLCINSPIIE